MFSDVVDAAIAGKGTQEFKKPPHTVDRLGCPNEGAGQDQGAILYGLALRK
jgi:hypothetical protein